MQNANVKLQLSLCISGYEVFGLALHCIGHTDKHEIRWPTITSNLNKTSLSMKYSSN